MFGVENSWILGVLAVALVAVVIFFSLLGRLRGNVTEQVSIPSNRDTVQGDPQEPVEEDEEKVLVPVVGQTYPFVGSFVAKIRVDSIDEDEEKVYGNLLIKLDAGCEIKAVQKAGDSDDEEAYVCVTYVEGGVWKTLTWYWKGAIWPAFDPYEPLIDEVEVMVAS